MQKLNNDWEFTFQWTEEFGRGEGEAEAVRLPHTVKELPLHYADSNAYQTVCGYRKRLTLPEEAENKRIFLQFDGAAHIATVYMNGKELATHRCGYTYFRVEITEAAKQGENLLAVKLDTTENPSVPPFGFVIDYLTYGGLYRDVWLDIRPQKYISDVFIYTPSLNTVTISCKANLGERDALRFDIVAPDGTVAASGGTDNGIDAIILTVPEVKLWDIGAPNLYTCRVTLMESMVPIDVTDTVFGFRTAEFRGDGFYLNGKKLFLRGVNRHQSYPYIGYAAPEKLQREDARIIRHELQCNSVRTSHYPQSRHFVDECDRQGLLVFTEIPGWQHVGDGDWKEQACENVREMVLQYRNHPSVILWGVRINESGDDDAFYAKTNEIAHQLDYSRATSGVRCILKSSLLEDVYAYNDFSHQGDNPGARPKKDVTPDMSKPLIISECNGHMYPTKSYDDWAHRQEQALRHARVLDAAMSDGGHAGFYSWCMFDYQTHKDFGAGDRICYHGIMDAFRNPKLAAAFYAAQGEEFPVLEIGAAMDIGDYPGGQVGKICAFTNADEIALYKNDDFVTTFRSEGWKALRHGPVLIDDTIGVLLETNEGFSKPMARAIKKCLLTAAKYGLVGIPANEKQHMDKTMASYGLTREQADALYNRYVGDWGGEATVWRFDAIKDDRTVASVTKCPTTRLRLEVKPSHTDLTEGDAYDMAAVRIRVLDEYGNLAPYAQPAVTLSISGNAAIVGPQAVTAEGGSTGTYVSTIGKEGTATLTVAAAGIEPVQVEFLIKKAANFKSF